MAEDEKPSATVAQTQGGPNLEGAEAEAGKEGVGCRRVILIIVILLILLLLFLPTPKRAERRRGRTVVKVPGVAGQGTVGLTHYAVLGAQTTGQVGGRSSGKAAYIVVRFTIQNLARSGRTLDYSAVKLIDPAGTQYPTNTGATDQWYRAAGKSSPWEETVRAGQRKRAVVVFAVFRGPAKSFNFAGRDIGWITNEYATLGLGKLDTSLRPR